MTALLDRLAPDWKKKNPIRADDKHNSFGANKDGWQDHGTGDKGDQITFLERFEGLSAGDATWRFLELARVVPARPNCHVMTAKPVQFDWSGCAARFTDTKEQELADYRGYSLAFVQWLKAQNVIGVYRDDCGTDQFALPIHDEAGNVVGIHHKHTDGKWRTQGSIKPLIIGARTAAKYLVFESQWDAFAVMDKLEFHKYEASYCVLITRGAGNGKFTAIIPAQAEVIVVMQNDVEKKGAVKAEDWLEEINQQCPARLKVARPPSTLKDCNDWLKRGDAGFDEMLAKAEAVTRERLCLDWIDFNAEQAALPDAPEIVKGMIRRGEKASLGGSSKSKKTWTGLDLALSVASGNSWLGVPTSKVPVVIVDMELRKKTLQLRISKILDARGIMLQRGELHIISLRGKFTNAEEALAFVKANCPPDVGLFFFDPFYKLNGGKDENSAGDIISVMNLIDKLATKFEAAILFSAHFSKGNQAGKESIDRISGSGVYGRDADTIISMTAHEEPDCFTVEPIFRSFAPILPWVVRWNFPLMERADELDPAKLKKSPGSFVAKFDVQQVIDLFDDGIMRSKEVESAGMEKLKMSDSTVKRLLRLAKSSRKLIQPGVGLWQRVRP